ncbi:unnamed protein product [Porites lobata]|uniref:G-protein coupled receptors family 1 profile domain-containing protein n=1 Tax=Porites lobata TaxID=104759 RepID=A0ABN8R929_9CNID|nr:unnamed protein product [Porites lobata]
MFYLHTKDSFLVGGQLGQALCKLIPFFGDVSFVVSIQSLILIAVDRFGAVVFPLRSPLIRSKLCPFFILATWIVARAVIQSCLTAYVQFHRYVANLSMNLTVNGSSGSWNCLNFSGLKIGGTVAFCLIIIVSLVANSLIVIIVYKTPKLRKPINYFIANMALSDLMFSIFWIPWSLSDFHTNYLFLIGGQLGQALCKLVPFFRDVSSIVSIQNLILIAVDRFGAVVFPLRSPLIRSKLCPFFILATWIVPVAVNSPFLFANELVESPERNWCVKKWKKAFGESSSRANFVLALYILFIYLPVLLLVILYSIIVIKVKTQAHPGEQSANSQQHRDRKNRNVLQMSIAILTVFGICWLPVSINFLIILYQDTLTHLSCSFRIYDEVTIYMATAYCAINPVICFMFSSNYRKALKRLIKCSFVQA